MMKRIGVDVMLVGYARVSTKEQNLERQLDMLVNYGVDIRNIYKEKMTGTKSDRVELNRMIDELQLGDTVVFYTSDVNQKTTKKPSVKMCQKCKLN